MRIIAICGAHKQGKTETAQLMSLKIPNSYIVSMYDILNWVYPGHKVEEHKDLLDKILSIRKNFFIDALKVKLAFIPESCETIIIDDVDDVRFVNLLERKLNAITVCVSKKNANYIPFHLRELYSSPDYFKTRYRLEAPTLPMDLNANVHELVRRIKEDELQ